LSGNALTVRNGNVDIDGSVDIDGATAVNGALTTTGATTLNGALTTTGATTLNGDLVTTGITTLNNTLNVNGTGTILLNSGTGGIINGQDGNHSIHLRIGNDGTNDVMDFYEYGKIRFYTGGILANQTERMCILNTGNVGIGTTNPGYLFHVNGTARVHSLDVAHGGCTIRNNDGHFVRIYISNGFTPDELGRLYFRGTEGGKDTITLYANGFSASSDDRLKAEEQKIENATETIMKLSPQIYKKCGDVKQETGGKIEAGLIAQDVWYNTPELRHTVTLPMDPSGNEAQPLPLPEGVNTTHDIQNDPDYASLGWTENEIASLDYMQFIPYLIKCNQEQQREIETLKTQQTELITRVTVLENA
jgi:hypothetical protein